MLPGLLQVGQSVVLLVVGQVVLPATGLATAPGDGARCTAVCGDGACGANEVCTGECP